MVIANVTSDDSGKAHKEEESSTRCINAFRPVLIIFYLVMLLTFRVIFICCYPVNDSDVLGFHVNCVDIKWNGGITERIVNIKCVGVCAFRLALIGTDVSG